MPDDLRTRLVAVTLEWEARFGVAPSITSAVSEYDAAVLLGCTEADYCDGRRFRTSVSKGHDFTFQNHRYQVKANRPSGKPGSFVTLVAKPTNYDWDFLIWILYDRNFSMQEAWLWPVEEYQRQHASKNRISPADMRKGEQLFPQNPPTLVSTT